MSQPFVGQVIAVGVNFAPVGWALCNGQLLDISQYQALYTLIGTTYGGNGQTTFALPNLQGRVAVGVGQGPGLSNYVLGQLAGTESVTLNVNQIAAHTHNLAASANQTQSTPAANEVLGTPTTPIYLQSGATTGLAGNAVGNAPGGATPHENRQPFQTINYIIALEGIFPTQS
jgi:microcystin-dependent protein